MDYFDYKTQVGRLLIAANRKNPGIKIPADLAHHLEIDHQVLTNWKRRGIPASKLFEFADEFDCNARWLRDGKGHISDDEFSYSTGNKKRDALFGLIKQVPEEYLEQLEKNMYAVFKPGYEEDENSNKNGKGKG